METQLPKLIMISFVLLFLNSYLLGQNDVNTGTSQSNEKNNNSTNRNEVGSTDKKDDKSNISAWIGYQNYKMNQFNNKLSSEGNDTIDGGLNAGLEFSWGKQQIPIKGKNIVLPLNFPVGIEYLEAKSKTAHAGIGGQTTVNWELPVVGIYFAPQISLLEKSDASENRKGFELKLRPIGIGYYMLGEIMDAKLTVSDRSGCLEVSGDTIGSMSQIGLKYMKKNIEVFLEYGYRWLKFTDVERAPRGGFSNYPPSNLPETLDYSGFMIKVGVIIGL
jgi:hypothetical protein